MRTRFGLTPMIPRDPTQPHRTSSALEAFFDLVFVVAVSLSSAQLHHFESDAHVGAGVVSYVVVFIAIWWAWMNFTWFATSFDTDDWLYRVLTLVQMSGALLLAAGTPSAMLEGDFTIITYGYVIMRLAMVAQWLRAAASSLDVRRTALTYAIGIAVVQVLWVARLQLPGDGGLLSFAVLMACELLVPVIAERTRQTPWHPEHITERYGLFTMILLGESVLASANATISAFSEAEHIAPLVEISACGLILAAGMWWTYFARDHAERIGGIAASLFFGYGHFVIFAAAGAFSAGIAVAIDVDTAETNLAAAAAAATVTVPVSLFLLGTWVLTLRRTLSRATDVAVVTLAVLIGLSAFAPHSLLVAAVLMVVLIVVFEASRRSDRGVREKFAA